MSTKPQVSDRLEIVDAMRGLAVLAMLILHSAHGWVQPELRTGAVWYWITSVGGMAAPHFFLVTGVSLGLRWDRVSTRTEVARGLSLLVLGYLLRVQMWLIDVPALLEPRLLGPSALLVGGYLGLYRTCARTGRGEATSGALAPLAAAGAGIAWVAAVAPGDLKRLLRFDVLQGLGLALVLVALVSHGAYSGRARVARTLALAGAVLGATPWLRTVLPGDLPLGLAAALGPFPASAPGGWAMFPLAPWCAYTCLGTALGVHLRQARSSGQLTRVILGWAAGGALLATLVSEDWPHVAAWLETRPPLVTPIRVAYRLGVGLAAIAFARLILASGPPGGALARLGRASLWVYWIHLEFAFGTLGTPARRALTYPAWAGLLGVLTAAMLALAWWRGHQRETSAKHGRPGTPSGLPGGVTNLGQGA